MRVKVPVDAVGLALLVIGVGALQFMLDNGNEKDWFHSQRNRDRRASSAWWRSPS